MATSRPIDPDHHGQRSAHAPAPIATGGAAVVGFDDTAASQDALAYAVGWAGRVGGRLDVLYVPGDYSPWIVGAYATAGPLGIVPDYITEPSRLVAESVAGLLAGTGLTWSFHTAGGDVARALEQHAETVGADAIIIGQSRRHHPRLLRASIACRLLSITDRIIIVIP